ncbi:MAG: hypothetical protein ABIH23_18230, partial [bacterium]
MQETRLNFRLSADTAQGKAAIEGFTAALRGTKHAGDEAVDTSARLSGAWTKIATVGVAAAATAAAALGGIAVASTKMAMEAVESENLFAVSMGRMAGEARRWSEDLSASVGLNEYTLRKQVGMFNAMFSSMGLGTKAAYDLSTGLTKLAYDMASFYNLKPEEAFDKLRAGITGEAEPLKRLGILIDETTVKTYAYTNGIAKQGEELTNQQKVLARYGTIMRQTALAQGDMERTITSPANALRVMRAQVDQLMTTLGMAFLPVLQLVVSVLNDLLKSVRLNKEATYLLARAITAPVIAYIDFMATLEGAQATLAGWVKSVLQAAITLDKLASSTNPFYKSHLPELKAQLEIVTEGQKEHTKSAINWLSKEVLL